MKYDQVLEERQRRREDVAKEIAKRKVVQVTNKEDNNRR